MTAAPLGSTTRFVLNPGCSVRRTAVDDAAAVGSMAKTSDRAGSSLPTKSSCRPSPDHASPAAGVFKRAVASLPDVKSRTMMSDVPSALPARIQAARVALGSSTTPAPRTSAICCGVAPSRTMRVVGSFGMPVSKVATWPSAEIRGFRPSGLSSVVTKSSPESSAMRSRYSLAAGDRITACRSLSAFGYWPASQASSARRYTASGDAGGA